MEDLETLRRVENECEERWSSVEIKEKRRSGDAEVPVLKRLGG